MAEVIGLEEKKRETKGEQDKTKQTLALLKVLECASFHLKCARGTQLELSQMSSLVSGTPYRFFHWCRAEFGAFQERVTRGGQSDAF
jgi:hypothetical protein